MCVGVGACASVCVYVCTLPMVSKLQTLASVGLKMILQAS